MPLLRRRFCFAALAGLLPFGPPRPAGAADAPAVLTVSGGAAPPRDFTLAELEALGLRRLTTTTPWTQGPQNFAGVPLEVLLRAVDGEGASLLRVGALNRFEAEVPAGDGRRNGALLATRLDGQAMRVRDRGPIWLIYPWRERPELDRPEIHQRSVWQIRRIELH